MNASPGTNTESETESGLEEEVESSSGSGAYYCVHLTIFNHPHEPLNGNRLAVSGEFPDDLPNYDELTSVRNEATDRFDLDSWQKGLYVARVYLSEDGSPVGVAWEETPQLYEHGSVSNPVETVPGDLSPVE